MANNLFTGPNAVVAKNTVDFVSAGITALNTAKIFLVDATLKSYVPGRSINGISGFVAGKGYYIQALTDMDLSANVVPPLSSLTQLAAPGSLTVTPGDSENVLDWPNVTSATSYTVDRATNSGFTTGIALNIYTGSTSAFTDTGRTNGTQYFYRVKATASGFSDSNYATGNGTPAVVTLLSGFARVDFDVNTDLVNTANVITSSATDEAFGHLGHDTLKLPSGVTGRLIMKEVGFGAGVAASGMLGFNTSAANVGYAAMPFGLQFLAGGNVAKIEGSGTFDTGTAYINGNWYGLLRDGTTGAIKLQTSADNGGSWTDIATLTPTSTADLWPVCDIAGVSVNKIYYPQGSNLA
jgi:hypothetical protein